MSSPIPVPVVRILAAFLAVAGVVAFAIMFAAGIADVLGAPDGQPPTQTDSFLYVATAVASLVGGVVAVGFGVKVEVPGILGGGANPRLLSATRGLGNLAVPGLNAQAVIGSIYAVVYVVVGIAGLAAWVTSPAECSALVKNLATTFLGLAGPIVAGFFRD